MNNPMLSSIEFVNARRHAEDTMRVSRMRGWTLPPEYTAATAVVTAAQRLAREPEPAMTAALPDPKKIRVYCDSLAVEREQWRARVAVANEVHDRAVVQAARAGRDAAPGITERLVEETNSDLIPTFEQLVAAAPRALTGHESPEQLTAHSELLLAVEALTAAATDRAQLAIACDEAADLGTAGALFLLIDPTPDTRATALEAAIATVVSDGLPATVDRWAELVPLRLRFARVGEAAQRLTHFSDIRGRIIGTPDGGLLDRTLGELAALAG